MNRQLPLLLPGGGKRIRVRAPGTVPAGEVGDVDVSNPAPPPSRAATRWLSPQDWSLRVKLAVALLVPSLIAIVLGGLRVADQAGEAAEFDRVARYATAQGEVAGLVKRIQDERLRTTEFVAAGRSGDTAALQASFAEVDAEQAASRSAVAEVAESDATVVGAQRQAEQALVQLPQLRDLALRSDSSPATVASRYSELIDQVLPLDSSLLRGVNTPEVNGLANALGGLSSARDEATLQQALITVAAAAPEARSGELAGLAASEARLATGLDNFRTALDSGQRVRYAGMIAGSANNDRSALATELTGADQAQPLPGGTGVRVAKVYGDFIAELDAAEDGIRAELAATGESARSTAVNLAVLNVAVLLAALIIGAIIVGLIARALLSSLRTLRSSALEIAQKRLPDAVQRMRGGTVPDVNVTPVPVHTREEVGEVARAFDAVHEQAVRLAAEQATLQNTVNSMFVNLSRRSQSLVDRQLQLIEELESNEQDPDQLASLFRLDHLATRMRRNSENLLVLAGTDLAKRTAHHVPVVDVLQAAVSEVEQYERVTVEQPPAVAVLGRAANDLQHLLSELLDNATSFSPPETQVTMSTSRAGAGPLVVEIVDRGIGMRPDELDEINQRFADADDTRITASRRMGLFVVGRLAARHGVQVRLFAGAPAPESALPATGPLSRKGGGVTARVTIPAHLVASGPAGTARRPEGKATASARPAAGTQPSIAVPPQRSGSGEASRVTPSGDASQDDRRSGARSRSAGTADVTDLVKRIPAQSGAVAPEFAGAGPNTPEGVDPESADAVPADSESTVTAVSDIDSAAADSDSPEGGVGTSHEPGDDSEAGAAQPVAGAEAELQSTTGDAGAEQAAVAAMEAPELFGPAPVFDPDEEPSSRTPIFEEVASGWFRAYRQVPINWQPDDNGDVPDEIDPDKPVRQAAVAAAAVELPPGVEGPLPVPSWPPPTQAAETRREDDFATAADDGWRAAVESRRQARVDLVPGTDLPRRTPGAQLLPGGIAAGGAGGSSRDADAIRSRLSNYQRGVRTGRSARERSEAEDAANPAGSTDTDSPELGSADIGSPVSGGVDAGPAVAGSPVPGAADEDSAIFGPAAGGPAAGGSETVDAADDGSDGARSAGAAPAIGGAVDADAGSVAEGGPGSGPSGSTDSGLPESTRSGADSSAAPTRAGSAGSSRAGRRRLTTDRGDSGTPLSEDPDRGSAHRGTEDPEAAGSGSGASGSVESGPVEPGGSAPDDAAAGGTVVAGSGAGADRVSPPAGTSGSHELRADRGSVVPDPAESLSSSSASPLPDMHPSDPSGPVADEPVSDGLDSEGPGSGPSVSGRPEPDTSDSVSPDSVGIDSARSDPALDSADSAGSDSARSELAGPDSRDPGAVDPDAAETGPATSGSSTRPLTGSVPAVGPTDPNPDPATDLDPTPPADVRGREALAGVAAARHRSQDRTAAGSESVTGAGNGTASSMAAPEPSRSARTPSTPSSADAQRTVGRPQEPDKRGR